VDVSASSQSNVKQVTRALLATTNGRGRIGTATKTATRAVVRDHAGARRDRGAEAVLMAGLQRLDAQDVGVRVFARQGRLTGKA